MTTISAANNLTIDLSAGGWKLRYAGSDSAVLAEPTAEGLRYGAAFGQARRLPQDGLLPIHDIEQVVLGWQKADECWHLGLLLKADLAQARGSRWCELARWPDPDQTLFQEQAYEAGERVGILLDVPFHFIQPEPLMPATPARDLPPLPLVLGPWELVGSGTHSGHTLREGQLAFVRTAQQHRALRRRVYSKFFWAVVYAAASILTLVSRIDLPNAGTLIPNPQVLPYLGLLISVGLVSYGLYLRARFRAQVSLVLVDGRAVTGYNHAGPLWEVQAVDARSLYVSEVMKRQRRLSTEYGELNVHLGGGVFQHLISHDLALSDHSSTPPPDFQFPRAEAVQPLTRASYYTDLQAAALYVGEAMKLPVWLDVRISGLIDQFIRMR